MEEESIDLTEKKTRMDCVLTGIKKELSKQ